MIDYEEVLALSRLDESQLMANRHVSPEEAEKITSTIISAITSGNFYYRDREDNKNSNWFDELSISEDQATAELLKSLKAKHFVCSQNNRNERGTEVYTYVLKMFNKWNYLKFQIHQDGKVEIFSYHGQPERAYVDYRMADDDWTDNSFVKLVAKDWEDRFAANSDQMKKTLVDGDYIVFVFKKSTKDPAYYQAMLDTLIHSRPRDKELHISRMSVHQAGEDGIICKVLTKED